MKKKKETNESAKAINTSTMPYNATIMVVIIALAIWGLNRYAYQKEAMKDQGRIKAKVIHLRNSTGNNLSLYPYITYQFVIDGYIIERGQKSQQGLSPHVGDCIEVVYSKNDLHVSEIDFAHGIVPCD